MKAIVRGSLALSLVGLLAASGCASSGLGSFGAEMGKKSNPMGGYIRVPYTSVINYFGYVKPGEAPDATVEGKKFFYLYVWIPAVAPEIGVRMASPVGDLAKPNPEGKDFIAKGYDEGAKDMSKFFDTYLTFERALTILNPEDIEKNWESTDWIKYAYNDDSSEMPKNPRGSRYNSLLRVETSTDDPTKALVRGLYRIGFTTFKRGEVEGTFIAQVGAPIDLPGVVIAKTKAELVEAIKKASSGSGA